MTTQPLSGPPTSDIAFTPAVKAIQTARGSREAYAQQEARGGFRQLIDETLIAFLMQVDTAYLATAMGARAGLLVFGMATILLAIALTLLWVKDTLPWAKLEAVRQASAPPTAMMPRYPANIGEKPTTWEVFTLMSWRDRRLAAICQAGLVEKFVDGLVWVFYPVFLYQHGLSLPDIGWTEFDPTNALVESASLIRVATTRTWQEADPMNGSIYGSASCNLSVLVDVDLIDTDSTSPQALVA